MTPRRRSSERPTAVFDCWLQPRKSQAVGGADEGTRTPNHRFTRAVIRLAVASGREDTRRAVVPSGIRGCKRLAFDDTPDDTASTVDSRRLADFVRGAASGNRTPDLRITSASGIGARENRHVIGAQFPGSLSTRGTRGNTRRPQFSPRTSPRGRVPAFPSGRGWAVRAARIGAGLALCVQRRSVVLDLQEAHADGVIADDGSPEGLSGITARRAGHRRGAGPAFPTQASARRRRVRRLHLQCHCGPLPA
jgi:hypothetical protein